MYTVLLVAPALIAALAVFNLVRLMRNASAPLRGLGLRARWAVLSLVPELGVVTLEQAQLNTQDAVDLRVIDEFRKSSALLDALPFDDAVNPSGGGATLTYGYTRLVTQGSAAFRAINSEYTPQEVTKQRYTVDLHPLGGSFQIDRVLADLGPAAANEVVLQMQQKIKAANALFNDAFINGDSAVDENAFDGLDKALTGSSTEVGADLATDWSTIAAGNDTAFAALDALDEFLAVLDGPPTALIANRRLIAKVRGIARRAGMYTRDPVTFAFGGGFVERYGNVTLIDPGTKAGSNVDVIPVRTVDVDNTAYTIAVTGSPAGGTFSLLVTIDGDAQETAAIAYDADAAAVQAAIRALSNVPADSPTVTGTSTKTITFGGALTDQVVTLALSDNNLTGGTSPSVTVTEAATTTNTTNATDLYAVRLGLDGVHGVSMAGQPLVKKWLPDFTVAGAVKTGEVELGPVAVAVKATRSAAVLRNIKIA